MSPVSGCSGHAQGRLLASPSCQIQLGEVMRISSDMPARRLLSSLLVAFAGLAATILPASAAASGSPVVGHAYVNDNTAGTNTIAVLDRHADGRLTPAAGSRRAGQDCRAVSSSGRSAPRANAALQ